MFTYERKGMLVEIKLENEKVVKASGKYIDNLVANLDIDEEEAINIFLEDEGYLINEEQEELEKTAKKNKVKVQAERQVKQPIVLKNKEHKVKENPTKELIISEIAKLVETLEGATNINIENKAKLITFELNGESYKLDLVQKRKPKDKE